MDESLYLLEEIRLALSEINRARDELRQYGLDLRFVIGYEGRLQVVLGVAGQMSPPGMVPPPMR